MTRPLDPKAIPWQKRRPQRVYPWLCAALAVLCYANTLGNDFCDDDLPIIVQNPLVTEPGQWGRLWLKDYWHGDPHATPYRDLLYRPVAVLSHRLNHAIGGLNPLGYHLVNIALHALVTMLVYRLTRRLTGSSAAALIGGTLFAVLPIHTEAVNNVVGRAELLAAAFTLLALELFARPRALTVVGGALCALAACCSKESGAVVLLLVPLLGWYDHVTRLRPESAADHPGGRLDRARWVLPAVGLVLAAGVYLVLRLVALGGALYQPVTLTKTINVLADAPAWERVCGAFQLWGLYWAKTVWPRVLCLDYSILAVAPADSLLAGRALLGVVVLGLLAGWSVTRWRHGRRLPAVLTVALLVSYLPVSNTVVLIKTYLAERLWYLPSMWVAVIAGRLLVGAVQRQQADTRPSGHNAVRLLVGILVAVAVVAGLARCWIRNTEWRDEGTLYASAYRDHSDAIRAVLLYGDWLTRHGRYDEGIALMRRSIQIDLGFTDAHRLLGAAYLRGGEVEKALDHLQTADVQIPGHPWTQRLLARARSALGRSASAQDSLTAAEQAVTRNPADLDALVRLADELTGMGQLDATVDRLVQAEPRFGEVAAFHHRLAVALVMANRRDDGAARYRRALQLDPDNAVLLVELAMLLLDRRAEGDLVEARTLAERAYTLAPDRIEVRLCWAEMLVLDNRRAEAAALFRSIAGDLPGGSELEQTCRLRAEWLER